MYTLLQLSRSYVCYLFVQNFQELKGLLIKRGKLGFCLSSIKSICCVPSGQTYLQTVASSRQKIAKIVNPFLRDGTVSLYMSV